MSDWDGVERRNKPKVKDWLYRMTMAGNAVVWLLFISAMMVFHFARPELQSGVARFWGETVRTEWDTGLTLWLYGLLLICALFSIVLIFLRKQRSRRKNESQAANLIILAAIACGFIVWIRYMMP